MEEFSCRAVIAAREVVFGPLNLGQVVWQKSEEFLRLVAGDGVDGQDDSRERNCVGSGQMVGSAEERRR